MLIIYKKGNLCFNHQLCQALESKMISEAKIQEKISQNQSKFEDPSFLCPSLQPISRICINPDCEENSLICHKDDCLYCGTSVHFQCSDIKLKYVTCKANQLRGYVSHFIEEMNTLQEKSISNIHEQRQRVAQRQEFSNKLALLNLKKDSKQIIETIYLIKDKGGLKGKKAFLLFNDLKNMKVEVQKHHKKFISIYKEELQKLTKEFVSLKQKVFYEFLTNSEQNDDKKQSQSEGIYIFDQSNSMNNKRNLKKSLVDGLSKSQHNFLKKSLSDNHQDRKFKYLSLLFKASEHGFSAKAFHKNCDGIEDTLIFVRTQFGKTVVGFSGYIWNSSDNSYVDDKNKNTFLLSLDKLQKYVPQKSNALIMCYQGYGPIFGLGYDLCLSDECHLNEESYSNFPYSYNLSEDKRVIRSQKSYRQFSGATQGNHFRVIEYEVYKAFFKQ